MKFFKRHNHQIFAAGVVACLALGAGAFYAAESQSTKSRQLLGQVGEVLWRVSQAREKSVIVQNAMERAVEQVPASDPQHIGAIKRNLSYLRINLQDIVSLKYSSNILTPDQLIRYRTLLDEFSSLRSGIDGGLGANELAVFIALQKELFDVTSNSNNLSSLTRAVYEQNRKVVLFRTASFTFLVLVALMGIWYSRQHIALNATIRRFSDFARLLKKQTSHHIEKLVVDLSIQPLDASVALNRVTELSHMHKWMHVLETANSDKAGQTFLPLEVVLAGVGSVKNGVHPVIEYRPAKKPVQVPFLHVSLILEELLGDAVDSIRAVQDPALSITTSVKTGWFNPKVVRITVTDNRSQEVDRPDDANQSRQDSDELLHILLNDIGGQIHRTQGPSGYSACLTFRT